MSVEGFDPLALIPRFGSNVHEYAVQRTRKERMRKDDGLAADQYGRPDRHRAIRRGHHAMRLDLVWPLHYAGRYQAKGEGAR